MSVSSMVSLTHLPNEDVACAGRQAGDRRRAQGGGAADHCPPEHDRVQLRIVRREARLVGLVADPEAIDADAVVERRADGVRQQHEPYARCVPRRVTARLVVPLAPTETEAVPRGDRLTV